MLGERCLGKLNYWPFFAFDETEGVVRVNTVKMGEDPGNVGCRR